jgi:hypothetical protein
MDWLAALVHSQRCSTSACHFSSDDMFISASTPTGMHRTWRFSLHYFVTKKPGGFSLAGFSFSDPGLIIRVRE